MTNQQAKQKVFKAIRAYEKQARKGKQKFVPGKTKIQYAGVVYDTAELIAATDVLLDFKLTLGAYAKKFEERFSYMFGLRHVAITNSGSSANLLAMSALTSPLLGKRALLKGDEVITPAATFPTTFNPIVQNGLIPVLVDVELGTYNMNPTEVHKAISKKTRAIMMPHTLANPNRMAEIMRIAKTHKLFVVEDCCDALGSAYKGKYVGTFGDLATFSFYGAHHIAMGEGGAVATNNPLLAEIVLSFRDWGRAADSKTFKERFGKKLHGVRYDARFTFAHIGYNLKAMDVQAAIGWAQLQKLKRFEAAREKNFRRLFELFAAYEKYFVLPLAVPGAKPSWFAFPVTIRPESGLSRETFLEWLERHNIETRVLFARNILKQPGYKGVAHRTVGKLPNTETVFRHSFFLGVYPGITKEMMDYIEEVVHNFFRVSI